MVPKKIIPLIHFLKGTSSASEKKPLTLVTVEVAGQALASISQPIHTLWLEYPLTG